MSTSSLSSALRTLYIDESTRFQQEFASDGDGRSAITKRTSLIENLVRSLWQECIEPQGSESLTLVALGGFGRAWLFP